MLWSSHTVPCFWWSQRSSWRWCLTKQECTPRQQWLWVQETCCCPVALFHVYVTSDCWREINKENMRRYNGGLHCHCSFKMYSRPITKESNENPSLDGIKWPVFEFTTWNLNPTDSVIIDKGWGSNPKTSMMLFTFVAFIPLGMPCVDSLRSLLGEWV